MKKILVLLTGLLVLLPCAVQASDWFLGGGVQIGGMGRDSGPGQGCTRSGITLYPLRGMEVDYGLRNNIWMLYGGIRYGQAVENRSYSSRSSEYNRSWKNYSILLGGRLHVSREYSFPFKPSIGGALTYGWTRYNYQITENDITVHHFDPGYSKGGLGALFELGLLIDWKGPVTPFLLGQIHFFDADFDQDVYTWGDADEGMRDYLLQIGFCADLFTQ